MFQSNTSHQRKASEVNQCQGRPRQHATAEDDGHTDLPNELLIKIIASLGINDIVQCRLVSRHFKALVDSTEEIQYVVEIAVAGVQEVALNSSLCGSERMALLKKRQEAWKRLELAKDYRTTKRRVIPVARWSQNVQEMYVGNIFLESYCENGEDRDSFHCHRLAPLEVNPSQDLSTHTWSLKFPFKYESFVADPAQDLLVLVQEGLGPVYDRDYSFIVRFVHLSDGSPFSPGSVTIPAPDMFGEPPSIDVSGDAVGIVMQGGFAKDVSDETILVDWKRGTMTARLVCSGNSYRLVHKQAFALISDSCFLLGVTTWDGTVYCNAIEIWGYDKNAKYCRESEEFYPHYIAIYELPRLRKNAFSETSMRFLFSFASFRQEYFPGQRPYSTSHNASTLVVDRINVGNASGGGSSIVLAVNTSTFFREVSNYDPSRKLRTLSWDEWGPWSTRVFKYLGNPPPAVYGSRLLMNNLLHDFNALDVARDLTYAGVAISSLKPKKNGTRQSSQSKLSGLLGRFSSGKSKHTTKDHSDQEETVAEVKLPAYPGRIVTGPTVIPHKKIYQEDIVSYLPYRETSLQWSGPRQPEVILGGDPWLVRAWVDEPQGHWEFTALNPCMD